MAGPYTLIGDDRDYAIDGENRVIVAGNAAARHPVDGDCTVCYRLDETTLASATLADSGPNGYTLGVFASYYGAVVAGKFGYARKNTYAARCFYRANASAPNTALYPTDAATISAWLRIDASDPYPNNNQAMIAGPNTYNNGQYVNYGFGLKREGTPRHFHWVAELCVNNAGSMAPAKTLQVDEAAIGVWTLVTTRYDRTTLDLLINGEIVSQLSETRAIWQGDPAGQYFSLVNYVDPPVTTCEIAAYDVAKSDSWIKALVDRYPTEAWVPNGLLARDDTIASRCRARLLTRRGQWAPDRTLGSRLWEIKLLKHAGQKAMIAIEEALADMIVGGEIDSINPLEIVEDYRTGALGVRVEIVLPNEQVVPLGLLPLGGGA
jgi:phage gp46-like protein